MTRFLHVVIYSLIFGIFTTPALSETIFQELDPENRNSRIIIFMHGFTGNSTDTWVNRETNRYWPQIVNLDPAFNGTDIISYDYPTRPLGYGFSGFCRKFMGDPSVPDLRT